MHPEVYYVSWREVLWIVLISLALLFQTALMLSSLADLKACRLTGINGPREYIVKTAIIRETGRMITQALLLTVGVWGATMPKVHHHATSTENTFLILFMLVGLTICVNSGLDAYRTRRALGMVERMVGAEEF